MENAIIHTNTETIKQKIIEELQKKSPPQIAIINNTILDSIFQLLYNNDNTAIISKKDPRGYKIIERINESHIQAYFELINEQKIIYESVNDKSGWLKLIQGI